MMLMEEIKRSIFPTWGHLFSIIGVYFAATIAASIVLGVGGNFLMVESASLKFMAYVIGFAIAIYYAISLSKLKAPEGFVALDLSHFKKFSPILFIYGLLLVLVISILVEPLVELFPKGWFEVLNNAVGRGYWTIVTVVVAAPILEEILFRGILQRLIEFRWGVTVGILLSSAIFGMIHILPPQAINAFFVALALSYIFVKSGSLLVVILIHSVNNAISYFLMVQYDGMPPTLREMLANDTVYSVAYGILVVLFLYVAYRIRQNIRLMDKNREVLPADNNFETNSLEQ